MEEVSGIPGIIPALPLYPPKTIRDHVPPEEWKSCLEIWLFSIEFRLRLKANAFSNFKFSQTASGIPFLLSYLKDYEHRTESIQSGSSEAKLHHQCYFLLKRLLLATSSSFDCSSAVLFDLLGQGSLAFHAILDWKVTLEEVLKKNGPQVKSSIEANKSRIVESASNKVEDTTQRLHRLSALVRCLPAVSVTAIAGADYLEAIIGSYASYSPEGRNAATEGFYRCLKTFMLEKSKHTSLLLDTLFDMKVETERLEKQTPSQPTLLSQLLCATPFLRHLKSDSSVVSGKRGQGLVDTLAEYRLHHLHLHPPPPKFNKQLPKGKGKARDNTGDDMHMHKASSISQVHELFPDLSTGYILKLLDHFSDEVEAVIAALLEPDSLPINLQDRDSGFETDIHDERPTDLAPRSTPPLLPQRKNVFDGDEFDRLQVSSNRLHRGRKEMGDESQILDNNSRSKAAILAALATFDADDDERDDTYDVADVGGAVDNTLDSDERRGQQADDKNEEMLFRAWTSSPELFARDSQTRLSKARRQLQDDSGMGHEQLEGWAIMMKKDPTMAERLQQKYSMDRTFRGNQQVIRSTKWQATPSASEDEGNNSQSDGRRVGQAGIRGHRTWNRGGRGRGGGNTAGPADSEATQLARKRKEQGRGRGGGQHRRDGRAKKIGRGMAGPVE